MRLTSAEHYANLHGWHGQRIHTGQFDLQSFAPNQFKTNTHLWVYIEGDGLAWITPTKPSADPTPQNLLVLPLAIAQPSGNAVYLARPCQYTQNIPQHCPQRYWTQARFATEIIDAMDTALDTLKQRYGAQRINLVGYSGGAAIALLLAARRSDVDQLIAIAGNLDHRAWAAFHRIDPLHESLNPADHIHNLQRASHWYWVGEADSNMPPFLAEEFAARFPSNKRPTLIKTPKFNHQCCWLERWPSLFNRIVAEHKGKG